MPVLCAAGRAAAGAAGGAAVPAAHCISQGRGAAAADVSAGAAAAAMLAAGGAATRGRRLGRRVPAGRPAAARPPRAGRAARRCAPPTSPGAGGDWGAQLEAAEKEAAVLQGALAAAQARLAPIEEELRRAEAFQLPARAEILARAAPLREQVAELSALAEEAGAREVRLRGERPAFRRAVSEHPAPLSGGDARELREALARLDAPLRRLADQRAAPSAAEEAEVAGLLGGDGLGARLRLFGAASAQGEVEKRLYTLQEMKDNGVDPTKLLSPRDESLEAVRSAIRAALAVGGAAMILVLKLSPMVVVLATVLLLGAAIWDQVSNGGFLELLLVDSLARAVGTDYRDRVAQHEAGHFLVGYLFGVVPKAYTLSAWDAFSNCWAFNTQAGTQLCDRAVQQEVESGKISGKTLDIIVSLAVAGVVAEYLAFGTASGGADDMRELEQLFQSLKFDQRRTDVILRSAVLNTVGLLRRYEQQRSALVGAMVRGAPVSECIAAIETGSAA